MGVILVAYERESEQTALEQLLTGRGHRIVKAANGLAALDAARREPPHAVVSDIVLPRMDGFALCRKWKQDERLQAIPFVFYTRRHDDPKYERFALELGAEKFLARSEQPDALVKAIDELLGAAAPAPLSAPASARVPLSTAASTTAAPATSAATMPIPALDEAAARNAQALERAQQTLAMATERNQQAQARLRNQLAELEAANQHLTASEAHLRSRLSEVESGNQRLTASEAQLRSRLAEIESGSQRRAASEGQLRDRIAELEAASERLVAGEARFRRIFEANPLPMWIVDHATGGFIAVNDAALARYGYKRAEFLALKAATLSAVADDESTTDSTLVAHRRKDGTIMTVSLTSQEIEFDGRRADLVSIFDFTARVAAQRQLQLQVAGSRQQEFMLELFKQAAVLDEASIVQRVLDQAAEATRSPLSYLFMVLPAQKTIALAAWRDRTQPQATLVNAEPTPLLKAGIFAECVRARRATSSNDLSWKPQAEGLPDLQRYIAVPTLDGEEVVTVLGVANRDAGYDDLDQQMLATLGENAWRILKAKREHGRALSALHRSDVALQGMIDALLRLTEKHDPYTAGSAHRVAALAVALGRETGLDGERQHALRVAALLHDVGNVAVPSSVLAKPGRLTEVEAALMHTHVEEGCKLLADIDFGAPVAEIVYEHHERFDGSGYPRGLKGDDIMIEARILAIADVVEAMCSARPYRPALGMEAALGEINRGAGLVYDLHLATACTRLIQRGFTLPD